ncbi:MAG: efflux RND transporter permease subunit, partial [Nevskia sp.]
PISVRYPRELRDSIDELANLPLLTPSRQQITLGTVASVRVSDGPPMLRSENGRPVTYIYVEGRDRDLQTLVQDIQQTVARDVDLPPGISVSYAGQFEFLIRATERMKIVVPVTLAIIAGLLYLT